MSALAFPRPIKIFFCYDTTARQDRLFFEKLMVQLSVLRRQNLIDECYDSEISPGGPITRLLETYLQAAQIIVLLLSANFINSERCYTGEMQRALELAATGQARLIPVLLSPLDWEALPLSRYSPLPADGVALSVKRKRDAAFAEVAHGIRKVVEELAGQAKKVFTRASTPHLSSLYAFPYRHNVSFTDRDAVLASLASAFSAPAPPPAHQTTIVALYGLGGMGKTQIAQEYIRRSAHLYHTVLWFNASSRSTLSSAIGTLADQLALSEQDRKDEEHLYTACKNWLQNQSTWLLVLDHLDDPTLIEMLVPRQSSGHVLLTTQTQEIESIAYAISVEEFTPDVSTQFLLQRAGLLPLNAPLDQAPPATVEQARAIAQTMDGFPLALDQAGAYLKELGGGLASYLALFQEERAALLSRRGRVAHAQDHPDPVTVTLTLAIARVSQKQRNTLSLLRFFAFLDPDCIPYEMLVDGADGLNPSLRSLAAHPLILNEALAVLHSYALVHFLADSTTLRIHRLVQAILVDTLTLRQQRRQAEQVVRLVNCVFPAAIFENRERCQRYLAQAQHCATLIARYQLTLPAGALLLQRLGSYCYQQARYTDAATYLTQALRLHEQHARSEALAGAETLHALALLANRLARYQEAETLHLRALALREQAAGPAHPSTTASLHNLAALYRNQGRYQEAEHAYLRVLASDERAQAGTQPSTAATLNNLGLLYYDQGKYPLAEAAYRHALAIYTRFANEDHPDLAYTLTGLGTLAEKRGHYAQAEEWYQQALDTRIRLLGENHPETAFSLNKLADIYESQGKDQQARTLYQHALSIAEQPLAANHPDLALLLNNLAFLEHKEGNYRQAEIFYQRALRVYEQAEGQERAVASVLNNLGKLYQEMGDRERAEPLLRRALTLRAEKAGAEHPATAQSLANLAELLTGQGRYTEAKDLLRRALTIRRRVWGPTHPDVVRTQEMYTAVLKLIHKDDDE